ncbi:MAG: hypothetical protein LC674_07250 [Actinobacteria bacterium]|nr:hypothetical protein [Actinomycetota bacterium]
MAIKQGDRSLDRSYPHQQGLFRLSHQEDHRYRPRCWRVDLVVDQLNIHQSEDLVKLVAKK